MILTASGVSSTADALARWEIGEYICEAIVILGCAGEYIAEFTNCFTGGNRERKDALSKKSTLVLIIGLTLGVICLFRTNQLSGTVIESLGDKAERADKKANTALMDSGTALTKAGEAKTVAESALDKSNKANAASSSALTFARGAQQKVEQARADLNKVTDKAVALQKYVDEVARRARPRELDGRKFVEILEGKPQARVKLLYDPNTADAWSFARDIYWWLGKGVGGEKGAGWEVSSPEPIPPDAKLQVEPNSANTPPAMRFSGAFTRFGITFRSRSTITPPNGPVPSASACKMTPPSKPCLFWAREELTAAVLLSILDERGGDTQGEDDDSLPDDMIVVVIGPKPPIWHPARPK